MQKCWSRRASNLIAKALRGIFSACIGLHHTLSGSGSGSGRRTEKLSIYGNYHREAAHYKRCIMFRFHLAHRDDNDHCSLCIRRLGMPASRDTSQRVVIIGGGAFGLSTALELSQRGYDNIVVLDRHVPPVRRKHPNTQTRRQSVPHSLIQTSRFRMVRVSTSHALFASITAMQSTQSSQKRHTIFGLPLLCIAKLSIQHHLP